MIDEKLLDMLICPLTHDKLRLEGDKLVNVNWPIKYPIRDGIPVMLIEEGEKWKDTAVADLPVPPPAS